MNQNRSLFTTIQGVEQRVEQLERKHKSKKEEKVKEGRHQRKSKPSTSKDQKEDPAAKDPADSTTESKEFIGKENDRKTGSSKNRECRVIQSDERKKEKSIKRESNDGVDKRSVIVKNDSEKNVSTDSCHSSNSTELSNTEIPVDQQSQSYFAVPWWQYQVSTEFEIATRTFADWYRLYLPDPQETERNLEWSPPDEFYQANSSLQYLTKSINWNTLDSITTEYQTHI